MSLELNVSIEELRKNKIFVATPMYGGMCGGHYTRSCTDLASLCRHYGVSVKFFYLFNESLIQRARNYLVDEFLRDTEFTHLMFIDADIGFDANDVLALSCIASQGEDKDIVCAPYPKKSISWEKIKRAVDKGFADRDPEQLENYVGDYVFNPVEGEERISISEPVEVMEAGTGFMMIKREVFTKFAAAYPQQSYKPDHVRNHGIFRHAHRPGVEEISLRGLYVLSVGTCCRHEGVAVPVDASTAHGLVYVLGFSCRSGSDRSFSHG